MTNFETSWHPEMIHPEQLSNILEFRSFVANALRDAVSTAFSQHVMDVTLIERVKKGELEAIEIGAGLGGFSKISSESDILSKISGQMTHYEWNQEFIDQALAGGIEEKLGDAYSLNEDNESQDLCLYFSSMDTLDIDKALEEAKRVTKKGGKIVIINDLSPDPGPIRDMLKKEGKKLILSEEELHPIDQRIVPRSVKERQFDYIEKEDFKELERRKEVATDAKSLIELNNFHESIVRTVDPFEYLSKKILGIADNKSLKVKFNGFVEGAFKGEKEEIIKGQKLDLTTTANVFSLIRGKPKAEVIPGSKQLDERVEVQLIVLGKK